MQEGRRHFLRRTGQNAALYTMKKRESDKCETCHCRKSVEHVLKEREILKDRVMDMGREWSIKGLLEVRTIDYI